MRNLFMHFIYIFFGIIPQTRFYRFKSILLRCAGVDCDKSARIVSSARIITNNISIGKDTFIGHQALLTGAHDAEILIGNYVDIAPRVVILSGTHIVDMNSNHSAGKGTGMKVEICDGVWIGANSTILPGVTIGKKSIIGAGSVVVTDIPSMCIAVGNPCRPIKVWSEKENQFKPL